MINDEISAAQDLKWCEPCNSPIWCRAHDCCGEFTDEMPPKPVTITTAFDALWVFISEWWWPGFIDKCAYRLGFKRSYFK